MSKQIALVTGGSKGIGAAIALRLANEGYAVAINYASSEQPAKDLAAQINAQGGDAITVPCNVADSAAVERMFDAVETQLGQINVLVNNAGVMQLAPLGASDDALYQTHIDTNLTGVFNTLRQAANRLAEGGRIINLSTSVVGLKLENYAVYAATKAAVETLSAILSKELKGKQITVNCVAPGPTATALFLDGKPPALIEKLASMNPLGRLGQPEDIANAVAFLASPDGAWINGQVLRANGGMV